MALALAMLMPAIATAAEVLQYEVVGKKPQERRNFIQGLEILEGKLYVSSGNYGESRLMRYNFENMNLEISKRLNPRLFAEGLTILGDHIYQLTWRERMVLVFDKQSMEALEWFPIPGQGWGLTNNGEQLIYGGGSERLYFVSPSEGRISHAIQVTEAGRPGRSSAWSALHGAGVCPAADAGVKTRANAHARASPLIGRSR